MQSASGSAVFIAVWAFSSCDEWGLLFVVVSRLLSVVASPVAEHWLQMGISSCGALA